MCARPHANKAPETLKLLSPSLAKYITTPYDTATRKKKSRKLLHNPCTKSFFISVLKPTMYAASGTTTAIQAPSQNGDREESVLAKQSFLLHAFLLRRVFPDGRFSSHREKTGKFTNSSSETPNNGTDPDHMKKLLTI